MRIQLVVRSGDTRIHSNDGVLSKFTSLVNVPSLRLLNKCPSGRFNNNFFSFFHSHRGNKVSQWIKTFDRGYVWQANKQDKHVR